MNNLVAKFGPEPPAETTRRSRERLRRFLTKYEPSYPTDDASLDDYFASFPGSEAELFAHLSKKYGPEPLPDGADPLTDIYDTVDLSKELPYATVPDEVGDRFRSMIERPMAIYWFGLVAHWEPPCPATLRYGYVSSTHFYVADSETAIRRCIPLRSLRAIYINTKRDLMETRQCSVLFQVASDTEHDLFLTFGGDVEAKQMLWIIAEIVAKQNWDGPGVRILGLKDFEDVDSQVTPLTTFQLKVSPLSHQKLADHPDHNTRGHVASAKIGQPLLSDKLWHTESRGPNVKGLTEFDNTSLSYLQLKKSKFGAGQPNYRMIRPTPERKWRPADDIQLDTDPRLPAKGSTASAMFEQTRAIRKYSRDGKFGSTLPPIERDKLNVNSEFISPARSLAKSDSSDSSDEGIPNFEMEDAIDSDQSDDELVSPAQDDLSNEDRHKLGTDVHVKRQEKFASRNFEAVNAVNTVTNRMISTPSDLTDLFDLL
eukprot:GDKJ01065077.1.p1 GENE.GDKJ01065077.1~~GDKJ01065077.1.p1  ORF type:complete len:493 (+),score=3.30 GDKJ01065077.1:28-1479(+)